MQGGPDALAQAHDAVVDAGAVVELQHLAVQVRGLAAHVYQLLQIVVRDLLVVVQQRLPDLVHGLRQLARLGSEAVGLGARSGRRVCREQQAQKRKPEAHACLA